jgi:methyl-accepting chemotaxis protein
VRELAQRSAKEIKDLIRHSDEEVGSGVRLVSATGEALPVIEERVVAINSQLDGIAISAKEQSVGLSQVNVAVNQMDQVTRRTWPWWKRPVLQARRWQARRCACASFQKRGRPLRSALSFPRAKAP